MRPVARRSDLEGIADGTSLHSALSQCMYAGARLGKVDGDARGALGAAEGWGGEGTRGTTSHLTARPWWCAAVLSPLFERRVLCLLWAGLSRGIAEFKQDLRTWSAVTAAGGGGEARVDGDAAAASGDGARCCGCLASLLLLLLLLPGPPARVC